MREYETSLACLVSEINLCGHNCSAEKTAELVEATYSLSRAEWLENKSKDYGNLKQFINSSVQSCVFKKNIILYNICLKTYLDYKTPKSICDHMITLLAKSDVFHADDPINKICHKYESMIHLDNYDYQPMAIAIAISCIYNNAEIPKSMPNCDQLHSLSLDEIHRYEKDYQDFYSSILFDDQ